MALPNLFSRISQKLPFRRSRKVIYNRNYSLSAGFTLLELLVAMIVASIVVSGLLYLVVELLQIYRRESTLTRVQQDMQRAIDYVADDIKEAVYIYDDLSWIDDPTDNGLNDLPSGAVPILAFWRPDAIDVGDLPNDCNTLGSASTSDQCEVLKIRQSAYSLVVYLQKARDTNANWSGESRIIRYELDKYSNLANLTPTPGYRDPALEGVDFSTWSSSGTTQGSKAVLVDFVAAPTAPYNKAPLSDSCSSLGANYNIVPSTANSTSATSFFACIKDPSPDLAGAEGNGNQDAYLFLRGSVDGAGGAINAFSDDSALPTLETRVLMRGVINKNPAE